MSRTPQEFAWVCKKAAHQLPQDHRFAFYALGILTGAALSERRDYPDELISQAAACETMPEVHALEKFLEAIRTGALILP